jgi:von Willebrand factor type A domain.
MAIIKKEDENKIMNKLNLTKEESLNMLNLRKEKINLLCLEKKPLNNLISRVGVVFDFSWSMDDLYKNGTVQSVLERLFPLALQFDDNGEMEAWIFDNNFYRLPSITMENFYNYVKDNILHKYMMGGTEYSPVLKDIYKKYMLEDPEKLPNYIIFITDGENQDRGETTRVITKMSKYPIFIQFVGIGNCSFNYLKCLDEMKGRYVDNANFFEVNDINDINDDELYNKLLSEYPVWLEYKEVKKMIQNQKQKKNKDIFKRKRYLENGEVVMEIIDTIFDILDIFS